MAAPAAEALRRALEALPLHQRMLEEIFLHAPVGLQLYDRDGRCVLVNPRHTRMFGAVPPPDYNVFEDTLLARTGVADLIRRAFAGEKVSIPPIWYDARELRNVQVREARPIAVSAELVPLATGDEGVSHVLFVFNDVTEAQRAREAAEAAAGAAKEARERAEEAAARSAFLAEAGRLLASSLDLAHTLREVARLASPRLSDFCIVDVVDRSGEVRRVGAAHAESAQQPLLDRMLQYPPVPGSPQPARRVLDSGAPELLEQVDARVVAEHTLDAAHRELLLQLHVRSHLAVPLVGRSGLVGVISLGYTGGRRYGPGDVAMVEALASRAAVAIENARLYEDVTRSEERFRRMADAVPQIVWITDAQGRVEFFNRKWFDYTGADIPDSAAETADNFLHADDAVPTMEAFERARAGGTTFLVEHRIRSAGGDYRWFLVRGEPYRHPATGRIEHWFGASTDIHDLKLAETALREGDRRKDEFLAMLAHELRNPLAAISNTSWLVKKKAAAPDLERYFEILERQTRRLTSLVDDLMDVSRVTRGLITLRQDRVDFAHVVDRALESLHALLDERRHDVRVTQPHKPVWVQGDAARLEQVVVNLVTNAAKYTDPGGHIALALAAAGGWAELTVQDDGIGMQPEFTGRIFDLFTQAERGLARSQGGLGIGLTIVRRLVELHGGSIEAGSPGLGQGSTFRVRLPLAAASGQPGAALPDRTAAGTTPRRILVVDDSADIAQTLALVLESSGHQVTVAHNAAAALSAARELRPAVVLLDIGLPDLDGYEVARRLRQDAATATATLVALTGYGQPADKDRAAAAGFHRHFVKPVDIAELEVFLDSLPP